ncbi:MAG TPA: carboxypeptidase regulatory-like domain-containing protein [Thermoanaerobaculia bacterium]
MVRGSHARFALAVTVALLLASAVPAFAQLQTGNVYGTVKDEQGQALPGVTVTLEGVGAPQVLVTDEQGLFRFLNLYPGQYSVKAELDGFSPVEYPDVAVRVGSNANIEVTLSSAVTDVITVTGESPILDERKVNQGANVSTVELDKIPTARDPWSLLSQAPGVLVDRINVGGNESGQQSNFLGMGATSRDNTFAVDGVVLTDMNAVGASATYFDFGAFEEVQFTVSSTDVTVATSGVTINQVTKRGTNEWRGSGRFLRTDGEYQSDPFLENGNRIDAVDEYGAEIGGPLWKDRLWIWGAYGESDIGNIVQGGQLDRTVLRDANFKLNFQATQANSGVLHYWTNNKLKFGRGAGPRRAPETTLNQTTPQDIYKIEDTWIVNPDFVVTALASRDDGIFTLTPQGGLVADIFVDENNVRRGSWLDFRQEAVIDQYRGDANYFFSGLGGDNQLKFGGSFREQDNVSGTIWPGGKIVWAGNLFGLDEGMAAVGFQRQRQVAIVSSYTSFWVQDTLTRDRWTINAGLRYDNQELENGASSAPGNPEAPGVEPGAPPVLPSVDFGGNDAGGFTWETVVPRVGVTYSLGADRKALMRATFSRYAEQLGQLPLASRVSPLGYSYAYFYFADANGNLRLDDAERGSLQFGYAVGVDPNNPTSLISPHINDRNLEPTLTDEATLGYERAITPNFAGGLTLTYRNIHNIPETRLLVTDDATGQVRPAGGDDYVQTGFVCTADEPCPLPGGGFASPRAVYDLRSGLTPTGGSLYTNGDREQDYLGLTLSLSKRLANRWSLRSHFTYADWDWSIGDEFRFYDDPTDEVGTADSDDVFFEQSAGSKSDVFTGSRWSFNVNGLYQVAPDRPWGFNIGASVTGREGFLNPPFVRARSGNGLGTRNVQLTDDIDAFRHDDLVLLDARIDKDFEFGNFNLNLGIDGFNLLNEDTVLQRDRDTLVEDDRFGILEVLSPRVFRFGATLRFR